MSEKDENKNKKALIPKWRTKRQIFIYAFISIVLVILGSHGLINLEAKKTIMIFGDQDNADHNITFALSYFILGVIGLITSWIDLKTNKEREKAGLFKLES